MRRMEKTGRARAAFGLIASLAATLAAALAPPSAARAQDALCQNANAFCTPMIQATCVGDLLGAGSARIETSKAECAEQRKAYIQCIQSAAQLCPPERAQPQSASFSSGSSGAGGCSAEDARTLWDELKTSFFLEDLEGFAQMCKGRPQAMLAANRAKRIKDGTERPPSAAPADDAPAKGWQVVEAQAHLARLGYYSKQPSGVWDLPSSAALNSFQADAGLPKTDALTLGTLTALRERPTPQKRSLLPNVGGVWTGSYAYDDDRAPVGFALRLNQDGPKVSGRSDEPQTFGTPGAGTLYADWTGKISEDGLLAFVKTYDGTGGQNHSITYTGRLVSPNRVEGRWSINAYTNGAFTLTR